MSRQQSTSIEEMKRLVAELNSDDGQIRQQAREALVERGRMAIPVLTRALNDTNERVRWEAAKGLAAINLPEVAPALIGALEDMHSGVRWIAAEGLIQLGRSALPSLMDALIWHSDSAWIRDGAHHVLSNFSKHGQLRPPDKQVLAALDDIAPAIKVPGAAGKALFAMEHPSSNEI
jgi:HEAT repeat protein